MKPFLYLLLALGSVTCCYAATPKVLLAQANSTKIAQVKTGTLKTANVSWWGFDKADATECLQNAIDSGVPKLIVDNTGSDWIVNKTIELASNQEIIFEDGVTIQAKKGAFLGKKEALFSGQKIKNVTLQGQGNVVLRMQKADYDNPKLYEHAEWRHGIGLSDSSNVTIRNLTITQTGGDGLYLGASSKGYNDNILVEKVNFDDNYRQGISVISAQDLTIRNSRFTNTGGTAPQAGIDFEPNGSNQRLVNCLIEDSVFLDNAGGGIDISSFNFNSNSKPVSITVNNCNIKGNSVGLAASTTRTNDAVTGKVIFSGCTFDHNRISINDLLLDGVHFLFKDCTLDFSNNKEAVSWRNVPIALATDTRVENPIVGGITFNNVTVINDNGEAPIVTHFQGKTTLSDQVKGSILVQSNGKTTPFDLASFIQQKQTKLQKINSMELATIDLEKLQAPATGAPRIDNTKFYLRNKFTFLQYATKGEKVTITVTIKKVYARETSMDLLDPNGKKLQTYVVPYNNKPFAISFTAAETGLYRLVRNESHSQYIDIISANPGNGILAEGPVEFLPLGGSLYFQVPAGVKDFTIGVSTDSTADVALLDSHDKEVERHDKVNSMQLFSATRDDASKSEIWSLSVSDAVWAVIVSIYSPLVPVVSTNPNTLLLLNEPQP